MNKIDKMAFYNYHVFLDFLFQLLTCLVNLLSFCDAASIHKNVTNSISILLSLSKSKNSVFYALLLKEIYGVVTGLCIVFVSNYCSK